MSAAPSPLPTPSPTFLLETDSGGLGLGPGAVAGIGILIAVVVCCPLIYCLTRAQSTDLGAVGASAKYDECRGQLYGFIFFSTVFNAVALIVAILAASDDAELVADIAFAVVKTARGQLAIGMLGYVHKQGSETTYYKFDELPDDEIDYDYDWRSKCESAGEAAYGMLVPIVLVKLLSAFLVYKRVEPTTDAACYKWTATLVEFCAAVLILATLLNFSLDCLSQLPEAGDDIILPDETDTSNVSLRIPAVSFFLLIIAGLLNLIMSFCHLRIPTWGAELHEGIY